MKKIFVTGTGTNVGKTIVSAGLCVTWPADYWKPVQAGIKTGTDNNTLKQLSPKSIIYPSAYVLKKPASPNQSSRIEKKVLRKQKMLSSYFFRKQKLSFPKHLVIEGAGGILVPFNNRETMCDLIEAEKTPVIISALSGLGTLNHTFLTLLALRIRKIPILGVIMVGPTHSDNKKDIEKIGKTKVLLKLPILKNISTQKLKYHFKKIKPFLP